MTDVFAPDRMVSGSVPLRLARSAADQGQVPLSEFQDWFATMGKRSYTRIRQVDLTDLEGWHFDRDTGNLRHDSGRFFTVEGLRIRVPDGPVPEWGQPIINQPEVGILGILAREFHGVLHFLMQAKVEPGNCNGLQLSPTVQATRSNYTRVHRGRAVPYLDYFLDTARHRVLVDVRQSEQGSAFHQKRNRNIVVEVTEDVEVREGFRWLTLGQLHQLLALDNVVNMDARTVLSCLPISHPALADAVPTADGSFRAALLRSCVAGGPARHPLGEILSWITDVRSRTEVVTDRVPLRALSHWRYVDGRISHETGRFFDVLGVDVDAGGREVGRWMQPMLEPHGNGIVAFVVTRFDSVLHLLAHARIEAGYLDVVELAPTVQCAPENYEHLPSRARPPFLDLVLTARPDQIRYDTVLSEEGGRFHHAQNRYLVLEVDRDEDLAHPDFRWLALHQMVELLRHSHYVNVQARSLVACLHSLSGVASVD